MYALAADVILIFHGAFVGFVIFGWILILIGAARKWRWIRNRWFRIAHTGAICVVAFEVLAGVICPLTDWEYELRVAAGEEPERISFIGRIVRSLIYYEWPDWAFTVLHLSFTALVIVTLILIPPDWRGQKQSAENANIPAG